MKIPSPSTLEFLSVRQKQTQACRSTAYTRPTSVLIPPLEYATRAPIIRGRLSR